MISENMKEQLVALGLKKQQAESTTAEVLVNLLMNDDGKALIQEAKNQVEEMRNIVLDWQKTYSEIKTFAEKLLDIDKVQKEFGNITDERARTTIALYATLISTGERAGASGTDAVKNAGYVTYAYLGGQAKRDIAYSKTEDNKIQLGWKEDDDE